MEEFLENPDTLSGGTIRHNIRQSDEEKYLRCEADVVRVPKATKSKKENVLWCYLWDKALEKLGISITSRFLKRKFVCSVQKIYV